MREFNQFGEIESVRIRCIPLLNLYCFEDRGNRRVALRSGLTLSLARLVIQKGYRCQNFISLFFLSRKYVPLPIKWFVVGQCSRCDRMTRGRRCEHYQWNMDISPKKDL